MAHNYTGPSLELGKWECMTRQNWFTLRDIARDYGIAELSELPGYVTKKWDEPTNYELYCYVTNKCLEELRLHLNIAEYNYFFGPTKMTRPKSLLWRSPLGHVKHHTHTNDPVYSRLISLPLNMSLQIKVVSSFDFLRLRNALNMRAARIKIRIKTSWNGYVLTVTRVA